MLRSRQKQASESRQEADNLQKPENHNAGDFDILAEDINNNQNLQT